MLRGHPLRAGSRGAVPRAVALLILLCAGGVQADIDLEIRGVADPVAENISAHLSKWDKLPAGDAQAVRSQLQPAVTEALRALGYYEAEVDYRLNGARLLLDIEAGPRLRWGEVDLRVLQNGEPLRGVFDSFLRDHPFTDQQPFSHGVYESYKNALLAHANRQGYLDAQLQRNRLRIDLAAHRAHVDLQLEAGARYTLAGASFSESRLSEELVRSIAQVPQGRQFSADVVGEIYNRLLNSGYFAGVDIQTEKIAEDQVTLHVRLTDLARHRVSTGVGFGTDTGPWVKLRWERPALNERGHNLLAQLQLSYIAQEVITQYKIPWGHPQNEYVSWDSGWRRQDTEDVETSVVTTGLSYHRLFGESWLYSLHVDLESETSRQGREPEESSTYVIPSARVSRRFFDGDATDPRFGYRYWLHLATSDDSLGSDTDFHRLSTGVNTLFTLGERHSLLARLEFGMIETSEFDEVPLSQRFFTGGDQSVRGYDFESIAPRDENGDLTGGQRLDVASLEYRFRVLPNWQLAAFVDAGRSFLESDSLQLEDGAPAVDAGRQWRKGAGLGLRWKSPVGFIALDLAAPVNDPLDESGVRIHLYLGMPL